MAEHEDLIAEMPELQQMTTESRLRHAKQRRRQQLNKWSAYEKEYLITNKSKKKERKTKIKFPDEVLLLDAVISQDYAEVKRLLDSGIDPNARNDEGLTAVHQSSIDDSRNILNLLISYGANVNVKDNDGWTPLHAAATCGRYEICKILLKAGADLLALNNDSNFPCDTCDEFDVCELLDKEMNALNITEEQLEELRSIPEQKVLNDIKEAIRPLSDPKSFLMKSLNDSNTTLLHFAATYGYCQVAEFLLAAGVPCDVIDKDLWTPLHTAVYFGQQTMVEFLLSSGADPELTTDTGFNAFELCEDYDVRQWMSDFVAYMQQKDHSIKRRVTLPMRNSSDVFMSRRTFLTRRNSLRDSRRQFKPDDDFLQVLKSKAWTSEPVEVPYTENTVPVNTESTDLQTQFLPEMNKENGVNISEQPTLDEIQATDFVVLDSGRAINERSSKNCFGCCTVV